MRIASAPFLSPAESASDPRTLACRLSNVDDRMFFPLSAIGWWTMDLREHRRRLTDSRRRSLPARISFSSSAEPPSVLARCAMPARMTGAAIEAARAVAAGGSPITVAKRLITLGDSSWLTSSTMLLAMTISSTDPHGPTPTAGDVRSVVGRRHADAFETWPRVCWVPTRPFPQDVTFARSASEPSCLRISKPGFAIIEARFANT